MGPIAVARLTVVRRDNLGLAVVWLSALNVLLAVEGAGRQFIRPVHPADAGIDMVLVSCADLEDAGDPIVVLVRSRHCLGLARLLAYDGALVCDVDVVVAKVLLAVHWTVA